MKPVRYEDLTPSKVRRHAETTPSKALQDEGQALIEKHQRETDGDVWATPQVRPENAARNEYMAVASALMQFIAAKKVTPDEVAWCLQNPVEGMKFLENEARQRMSGTTKVADPQFAGFQEYQAAGERRTASHHDLSYMDRQMLGSGKTTRVTHNANGTRGIEMIDVPRAHGPWYRNANGELVMNNVRPSQLNAASARLERDIKSSRGQK